MHTTSASLLKRLKKPGQADAWARFVRQYSPMVYTWACKMGLQEADAADLVQDVFAELLKKLPRFDYDSHRRFRNWLWTVTRNKWREKNRRPTLPVEKEQPTDELCAAEQESLEEIEFHQYLLAEVLPVYEKHFKPQTWKAFWLHVVEGKSVEETAAELGTNVRVVYVAKCRVLARLHRELHGTLINTD